METLMEKNQCKSVVSAKFSVPLRNISPNFKFLIFNS